MSVLRLNRAAVAALLLAALAFTGLAAHGHDHDLIVGANGHTDLTIYSGRHHQPIPATHIEAATRIDSSTCLACLHQQRQRWAESPALALGGIGPDSSNLELEGCGQAVAGTARLPATRAPPRA